MTLYRVVAYRDEERYQCDYETLDCAQTTVEALRRGGYAATITPHSERGGSPPKALTNKE